MQLSSLGRFSPSVGVAVLAAALQPLLFMAKAFMRMTQQSGSTILPSHRNGSH